MTKETAARIRRKAFADAQKWARVADNEDLSFSVRYAANTKRKAAEARYAKAIQVLARES